MGRKNTSPGNTGWMTVEEFAYTQNEQETGGPRGPEAAQGNVFPHFSACVSLHLSAILPQRRARLPSWAWLYRGSHTGRCLCSSVPATTVSPACPRTSKGVRVSMGPDKRERNQEISWFTRRQREMQIPWSGRSPPRCAFTLTGVPCHQRMLSKVT